MPVNTTWGFVVLRCRALDTPRVLFLGIILLVHGLLIVYVVTRVHEPAEDRENDFASRPIYLLPMTEPKRVEPTDVAAPNPRRTRIESSKSDKAIALPESPPSSEVTSPRPDWALEAAEAALDRQARRQGSGSSVSQGRKSRLQ